MTLADLYQIKDFLALFEDPRFRACIAYLREHPAPLGNKNQTEATGIIRSEGSWHGWFDSLKALEDLGQPPKRPTEHSPSQKYQPPTQKPS